jgi:hypothetical protein
MVSVGKIRLDSRKSTRLFKGIICRDISEFESHMPSHAVGSLYAMSGLHAGLFLDRNYPEEIEIRFEGMRISLIERVRQDE